MNAYELADKLWQEGMPYVEKSANMLRQLEYLNNEHRGVISILMDEREVLRERIAELEKGLELVKDAYCARDSECRQLKGRIAELEKQELNAGGEPVKNATYWKRQHDKLADRIAELEKILEQEGIGIGRDLLNGGIAIFKKPKQTKPLSDEEIKEIALKVGFLTEEDLTPEWSEYTQEFVDCVRAIEAKVRGKSD